MIKMTALFFFLLAVIGAYFLGKKDGRAVIHHTVDAHSPGRERWMTSDWNDVVIDIPTGRIEMKWSNEKQRFLIHDPRRLCEIR